jgi:hypothetical protein
MEELVSLVTWAALGHRKLSSGWHRLFSSDYAHPEPAQAIIRRHESRRLMRSLQR